jgi:hypothetical protein
MAEELEELCRRLHLSDHEKHHLRLRTEKVLESKQEAQHSILFKLLTNRLFNGEALKGTVRTLWAAPGGVTIRDIDDNLFMAVFSRREDMDRIFVQSPWTFDKKLIQIVRFDGDLQPAAVSFKFTAFWVRVLNLPIKSMVRDVGEDIGNAIGRTIEVDVPENGIGWGRYLRICVDIDITQPLLRGKILEFDGGAPFWVDFRYEHLPIFCYQCGMLGHSVHDCLEGRRSGGDPNTPIDKFGPWLRAAAARGGPSRCQREAFPSEEDQESSIPPRRYTDHSVSVVHLVTGEAANGGAREVADVSSSENVVQTATSQLRGDVGAHVGGASISEGLANNPGTIPLMEGLDTPVVDEINTEMVGDSNQTSFDIIQPTNPHENHADNVVLVDNEVMHVERMGEDNMARACEGLFVHGLETIGGPSVKPKWKKRARLQHHRSSGMAPSSGGVITRAKRPLNLAEEPDCTTADEPTRKKRMVSGPVINSFSPSAEAAGQLRRSQ